MGDKMLSELVAMENPEDVFQEVKTIFRSGISKEIDLSPLEKAFQATVDLYAGKYPGYRACNTEYHDLCHTTDTFLTAARLVHGEFLLGEPVAPNEMITLLISALLHDSGYIQEDHDTEGTGAKYTATHVQRSMFFIQKNGDSFGLQRDDIAVCEALVLCTDSTVSFQRIDFPTEAMMLLGRTLGAADLLAQTADRTYLEKLLFLYHEFQECNVGDYHSEVDLLRKTVGFYDYFEKRVQRLLDKHDEYLTAHFRNRWDIDENLYRTAIENQRKYLEKIVAVPDADPRDYLKRRGVVQKVRDLFG
jgi:hypothetical protein